MNIDNEITVLQQFCIEDAVSKHNIRERVREDIGCELPEALRSSVGRLQAYAVGSYYPSKMNRIQKVLWAFERPDDIVLEVLQAVLQVDGVKPIQNVCAQIGHALGFEDTFDGVKTAAEILAVLKDEGIYTLYKPGEMGTYMSIESHYKLNDETIMAINKCKYLPPMLCIPKNWESNCYGGYISAHSSVILGDGNHHIENQSLDVLNIIQKVAFELDTEVLKEPEVSSKELDTLDKERSHAQLVKESRQIYQDMLGHGNEFYFVHKYDKRGRMYSQGYHINLQSYQYKKALLNFKTKEVISLT